MPNNAPDKDVATNTEQVEIGQGPDRLEDAPPTALPSQNLTASDTSPDILRYFRFEHLPAHLQEASKPFGELAQQIVRTL